MKLNFTSHVELSIIAMCYLSSIFDALGLPIITSQPQSHISFVCSAVGTPLPTITWKHGMTAASGAASQTVSNAFTTTSMLTLTSVERSRSGNYTCEVTNSKGTRSAVSLLTVLVSISALRLRSFLS